MMAMLPCSFLSIGLSENLCGVIPIVTIGMCDNLCVVIPIVTDPVLVAHK